MIEHTFHIFVYSTWKNGAYCANRNACDLFKDEVGEIDHRKKYQAGEK